NKGALPVKSIKKALFINKKGLSLVEVLASIVILSIILTSVLLILNQTARTNKESSDVVDASYIAQTEMENIYDEKGSMLDENYRLLGKEEWEVYQKEDEKHIIEICLKDKGSM